MNAQVHNNVVSEYPRNTHVERILTGARKQVPPQPHTSIVGHVTQGNVNRSAPHKPVLYMANVKHGVHNDGSDTADNRCENRDNTQCGVSPIVQKPIKRSCVQACGLKRCKKVVEKDVNNKCSTEE